MFRKKIIIIISIFLAQFFLFESYSVEPEEILKNSEQETRARNISKNIRCMICQNQSIDESDADLAKDLRVLIRNKIKEGNSDKEIYKFLTSRYGDFILLKPPMKFGTLILWFAPLVLLLTGILFLFYHNKKSKKI